MNSVRDLIVVLVLAVLAGCNDTSQEIEAITQDKIIHRPVLVDFPQSKVYIDTLGQINSMNYPVFISDLDTIVWDSFFDFEFGGFFSYAGNSTEISTDSDFDLIVDENQSFEGKFSDRIAIPTVVFDSDGNWISKPYIPPFDSIAKLPVFVVNNSDSNIVIENHDAKMVFIQEALDRNGEWKPLEYFQFSWCGNSYGEYLIEPNHVLMFGVNKYKGDFKTKLRVRLKNRDKIIFSNEYDGEVNEEQLKFEKTEYGIDWRRYLNLEKHREKYQ